jgi:hypothetical protein
VENIGNLYRPAEAFHLQWKTKETAGSVKGRWLYLGNE